MIIILCLYVVALWAVFSKFKLVRWGWLSGTVSLLIGGFILATFLAPFNYLSPSGRVTVTGRMVEVTPNVTRQIVAIPVKPDVPVKANDVLFQIDPAPFQYKVSQSQASIAAAKQVDSLSRALDCIKTMRATEPIGPIRDKLETERANLVIGLFVARAAAMRISSSEPAPDVSANSNLSLVRRG